MRFLEVNRAGTITVTLPRRPSAAGSATVRAPAGGILQTISTPVRGAAATTLSAPAAAGAGQLSVTSATGVEVGRRYLLGGPEETGGETITVRALSGTTVTLAQRLIAARAAGDPFESTDVTIAVGAISSPARGYRVEYAWPDGDAQPSISIPFDVTRYTPVSHLSIADLRALDPIIAKRVQPGLWLPDLVAEAWKILMRHVAQKVDPGGCVGTLDLTTAHGYLVRALLAETAGSSEEVTRYLARMEDRYTQERDAVLAANPYAPTQSESTTVRGGFGRTILLQRS